VTKSCGQRNNKSRKKKKEKGKGGNKEKAYDIFTKCYRDNSSKAS
jgi:hypothetical protein